MKKSFKTLALGLLTIGMLAGCKPAAAPTWTSEQSKIMSDNLYGLVLPYVSANNLKVEYDAQKQEVVITADELAATVIAQLAANFTADQGWTDKSDAQSESYVFEKKVKNSEDKDRFVRIEFGNEDVKSSGSGLVPYLDDPTAAPAKRFALYAYDPYFYAFADVSALFAQLWATYVKSTDALVPFEANYFESDYKAQRDSSGNIYFDAIYVGHVDADLTATYAAALTAANYSVAAYTDADGWSLADSPSENFSVSFKYTAGAEGEDNLFVVEMGTIYGLYNWPSHTISTYLSAFVAEGVTVDAIPVLAFTAQMFPSTVSVFSMAQSEGDHAFRIALVFDDEEDAEAGTAANAALTAYLQAIAAAGFTKGYPAGGSDTYNSPNGQYYVSPWVYARYGYLMIDIDDPVPPTTTWLTDEIAAEMNKLGLEGKTALPAYTGEIKHTEVEPASGQLYVMVYTNDVVDAKTAYGDTLAAAGFILAKSGQYQGGIAYYQYNSPCGSYSVTVYYYNGLTINVVPFSKSFPVSEIKQHLVDIKLAADLATAANYVPNYTGTDYYWQLTKYTNAAEVSTVCASAEEAAALKATIVGLLEALGYEEHSSYPGVIWVSADDAIYAQFEVEGSSFSLTLF